jgi:hypothetical protein
LSLILLKADFILLVPINVLTCTLHVSGYIQDRSAFVIGVGAQSTCTDILYACVAFRKKDVLPSADLFTTVKSFQVLTIENLNLKMTTDFTIEWRLVF